MRINSLLVFLLAIAVGSNAFACPSPATGRSAAVVSSTEAILAAKAAWRSVHEKANWHAIYSSESIARGEPYSAVLSYGAWHVASSVSSLATGSTPKAVVCQTDGSVSVSD